MNKPIIYTLPNCVQCDTSKNYLRNNGVEYEEIKLNDNPEALEKVAALGYKSAPVIFYKGQHWNGFKLDKLKEIINEGTSP